MRNEERTSSVYFSKELGRVIQFWHQRGRARGIRLSKAIQAIMWIGIAVVLVSSIAAFVKAAL